MRTPIMVRFSPAERFRLEGIARAHGKNKTEIIRYLLDREADALGIKASEESIALTMAAGTVTATEGE